MKEFCNRFENSLICEELKINVETEIQRITKSILEELEQTSQIFFERKKELQEQYRKTGRLEGLLLQLLDQLKSKVQCILISIEVFVNKLVIDQADSPEVSSFWRRTEPDTSI